MAKIELQLIKSISRMVEQTFRQRLMELSKSTSITLSIENVRKLKTEMISVENKCCKHMYSCSFAQLINYINYRCDIFYNTMIQK